MGTWCIRAESFSDILGMSISVTKLHFIAMAVNRHNRHYWSPINPDIERYSISIIGIFTFGLDV